MLPEGIWIVRKFTIINVSEGIIIIVSSIQYDFIVVEIIDDQTQDITEGY